MFESRFNKSEPPYTMYYDESNNHRKFYINRERDSYNIDNDPSRKQTSSINFMLAGVAHRGDSCKADPEELISSLRLQKSAKELKFDQVASGTFDVVVKSPKIKQILKWILDSDLLVHYFNLNMEYWAFVDIIDDCIYHCIKNNRFKVLRENLLLFINFQKDCFHRLVAGEKSGFLAIMRQFNFPVIEGRERKFIAALHELAQTRLNSLRSVSKKTLEVIEEEKAMLVLGGLLSTCIDIEEMGMTAGDEPGVLIDGLSMFYQNRGQMFGNSLHVFDEEFSVDDELEVIHNANPEVQFRHLFLNSLDSRLIQISDVIAGLLARYFDFIERNSIDVLLAISAGFNPYQNEVIGLMRAIIDKTDRENPHFLHYVMPASAHVKHGRFMFPDEYNG